MINSRDIAHFAEVIPDDFHYASQWVLEEISSKTAFLEYIDAKLATVAESNSPVFAEMARLPQQLGGRPCVLLAQGEPDGLVATVLAKIHNGQLKRIDVCGAPAPHIAERSGEYPR